MFLIALFVQISGSTEKQIDQNITPRVPVCDNSAVCVSVCVHMSKYGR